ncbi:MAG: LysM peptidoglycan-binding domain-containing protein [Verrucomicrobia bacterium]|nr:LysM peptidoglycan-binding domain-containing protein [Verrucomicrobiota bacterium]
MENKEEVRTQWLTQGLVLSLILNLGLFVVCVFYALRQNTIDLTGSLPVAEVVPAVIWEEDPSLVAPVLVTPAPLPSPSSPSELFCSLKQARTQELEEAFAQTAEFRALAALFAEMEIERSDLISLALESSWEELSLLCQPGDQEGTALQCNAFVDSHPAKNAPTIQEKNVTISFFHRVAPGESLWSIAQHYHLSVKELKEVNDLKNDAIYPGQTLKILAATSK